MTTTTASKKPTSILILYGSWVPLPAVITDSTGKADYIGIDFEFDFGDETQISESCSVTYRGNFFVFGGQREDRQISQLIGCSLERVGSLSFDFFVGACTVVKEESIYLCFDYYDAKQCYVGADPVGAFSKINESQFIHEATRVAASDGKDSDLIF